jgi:hypothetical protein
MELNQNTVVELLRNNDKAIGRALLVLKRNQTSDEQREENTKYRNNKGFRPCHARMGTSMANFFEKHGKLSEKQTSYWRVRDVNGNMRIAIYWKQLIEAAENKQVRV